MERKSLPMYYCIVVNIMPYAYLTGDLYYRLIILSLNKSRMWSDADGISLLQCASEK